MGSEAGQVNSNNQQQSSGSSGINQAMLQKILDRVKLIVTDPKGCWTTIKSEQTSVNDLFINYAAPLAAVPAICGFIGASIIGISLPVIGTVRAPFFSGIFHAVLQLGLSLGGLYILAMIVQKLAANFGGNTDIPSALKLVTYSMTPSWVAGILMIYPSIITGLVAFVGGLFSIYAFYQGIPSQTSVPEDRRLPYVGATAVVAIVIFYIVQKIAFSIF